MYTSMDTFRRLCQWTYRIFFDSPHVRWYFQLEDSDRDKTARLAKELVDSIKSIRECFNNLDQSIKQEFKEEQESLKLEESDTLLKVFESLDAKFKSIQILQKPEENNEYTLSKKVTSQDCVPTLLNPNSRFGQKLRTIKDYCKPEDQGFVIVSLVIHYELDFGNIIKKLYKICNILRNSKLGVLPMNVLLDNSYNIKQKISTCERDAEYTDVCCMLEEVMVELRPICDDFILKVSKMNTALEARYQTEDD